MHYPNIHARLAIISLLASSIILAGCTGTAQTITPTPTTEITATVLATPCAGKYTSTTNGFTVNCPAGWSVQPSASLPNGVVFLSPDKTAGFIIAKENAAVAASQYDEYLRSYLSKAGATNVTIAANHQPVTFGANTWTVTTATFTKGGTNFTINQYALEHNGKPVFVESLGPTATFATVQPVVHSTLTSLYFT
jgi:hypothetical protein